MSNRSLPFAMPFIGNEQEETIAVLSYVAEDLLEAHHRRVEQVRRRYERYSYIAFVVAFVSFAIFLVQDFEFAPVITLLAPVLISLVALSTGIVLRTRLTDPNRFTPPEILRAQKLSWEWAAIPLDSEKMILWDTLTDESILLDLPPDPPARQDIFLRDLEPLGSLEDEKRLVSRLGDLLEDWQTPSEAVRLPCIREHHEELVDFLGSLPRGRHLEPAPPLPPARPLDQGQDDLRRLMRLYTNHRIFLRQLDAWEESITQFKESMERALKVALPSMESPPPPPAAHPSGDVEALIGTLDVLRTGTIESLRVPLQEELERQQELLRGRLKELEQNWERERNGVFYTSETLISSLQRQVEDMEQRVLPEAEQALRESEARLREAQDRVKKTESELADKRKQLMVAGSGSSNSPRASDERKREVSTAVERLNSMLPEIKRGAETWQEVVTSQRNAVERERRRLERLQQEHQQHVGQRDEQLAKIDTNYEAAREQLETEFAPVTKAIEDDLHFFEVLTGRFNEALSPLRVDLIMDDEEERPYTEVVQQSFQLLEEKLAALNRWDEQVRGLIEKRRAAVRKIVEELDRAALPNVGLRRLRIMLLPVWYVEFRRGTFSLLPWKRERGERSQRLLAPFVSSKTGKRLALPEGKERFLEPLDILQKRLNDLMASERLESVQQSAARLGRVVPFDLNLLDGIGIACQLPRSMVALIRPLHDPSFETGGATPQESTQSSLATGRIASLETGDLQPEADTPLTDEFILEPDDGAADAWESEPVEPEDGEDAWTDGTQSTPYEAAPSHVTDSGNGLQGEPGREPDEEDQAQGD